MKKFLYLLLALTFTLTACSDDDNDAYVLQREDILILTPENGYVTTVGETFRLEVKSVSDEGLTYRWMLGAQVISTSKQLEYVFKNHGQHILKLVVTQGDIFFAYNVSVEVKDKEKPDGHHSPYIHTVLDYRPAVGQFVNTMPRYVKGDTQEDMNQKAFDAIGGNNLGEITLGGYGGYVIVGFDHTIENVPGKCDFRILGNAFDSEQYGEAGGNSEPGIVMVSYDANHNGLADDEWYELEGSAHRDPLGEPWLERAKAAGNDVNLYRDYAITYFRPEAEPKDTADFDRYIHWQDNRGNAGFKMKNIYHDQPYYPQWITEDELTFRGTCLPQNGIDESGNGTYYVCYKFRYGYADNALNSSDAATFDIGWAVTADGNSAHLKGVDFIKIYTGVNQENGWTGECSTEISGVEDLHLLGEDITAPEL